MLGRFQPIPSFHQILAPCQRTVVGKQQRVVILTIGCDAVGDALRAGGFVVHTGHRTQIDQRLGIDGAIQTHAGDGEGCADGRMGVAHAANLGVFIVDAQMHLDLAGRAALALGDHRAVQPELDEHVLRHKALGYTGGRGPDGVFIHLAANIAVVGGNEVLCIHSAADFNDQFFCLGVRGVASVFHKFVTCSLRSAPLIRLVFV